MSVVTSYKSPTAASGTNWTNPTNVYSSNDTRAQYANSAQDNLYVTGFDFSDIPTWSTILGVEVQVEGNGASATATNRSIKVGMTKNGSSQAGSFLASQNLPQTTDATRTYPTSGAGTNLFSTTLSLSELQASTRWVILATNNTNTSARNIDHVQVRVYYAPPISQLSDNFNDNSLDAALWSDWWGANTNETNQRIEIATTSWAANYYGIDSLTEYNLTSWYVSVEIVDVANQSLTSLEYYPLYIFPDNNNAVFFLVAWGTIYAYKKIATVNTSLASATYSSTTHKYVRIREASGTTYWEYSSDGISRNTLHSVANPVTVTAVIVELLIGTYAAEWSATTGKWDNINILPSASRRVLVVS